MREGDANIRTGCRFTAVRYLGLRLSALIPVTVLQRLVWASLLLAAGCGPPPSGGGRTLVDDLGRSVVLPDTVFRVVSLAPSVTELAVAAGAGLRLVAVTDADTYPPAVLALPTVQALPLDFEAVVALRPDLVLASDQVNDPRDAERLRALDIPTWFSAVDSFEGLFQAIERLGTVFGTEAEAGETVDSLRRQLSLLPPPPADGGPGVLVLIGDETLFAFGRGSYVHEIVARAGGRSLTAGFETRAPVLSEEFVLDAAPDVIVGAFGPDYDPSRLRALHPAWSTVPAIRDGRIFSLHPDLLLRPGPRLVEAARVLTDLLAGVPAGPAPPRP